MPRSIDQVDSQTRAALTFDKLPQRRIGRLPRAVFQDEHIYAGQVGVIDLFAKVGEQTGHVSKPRRVRNRAHDQMNRCLLRRRRRQRYVARGSNARNTRFGLGPIKEILSPL